MGGSCILSTQEQVKLIEKLDICKFQGTDKHGHKIIRIIGKLFPARLVSVEALKKYLKEKIFANFENDEQKKPFSVVYLHTTVGRCENFPGIVALRSICNAIPPHVKANLQTVYYVHPGIQSRVILATFGHLIFTGGLYTKVKYVSRLVFLWEHIRKKDIEIPEFVSEHDKELDSYHHPRLFRDYCLESDHSRRPSYPAAALDYPLSTFSMRCIG